MFGFRLVATVPLFTAFLVLAANAPRAAAQGVEAQIRCGHLPGDTLLPNLQIDDLNTQIVCQLQFANNTGEPITNADFRLTFGNAPEASFSVTPTMPEDIGARLECPTVNLAAGVFRPRLVTNVVATFPGFVSGTATGGGHQRDFARRCEDYTGPSPSATWRIASFAAGQVVSARVEFRPGYLLSGSQFESALRVDWVNKPDTVAFTPPTLPVSVSVPNLPPDIERNDNLMVLRDVALAGSAYFGTSASFGRPSHTGVEGELILPYLRSTGPGTYEARFDELYNEANGDILVFDPDDLEIGFAIRRHFESDGDIAGAGGWWDASDDSEGAFGTLPVVVDKLAPNRFRFPYGHLSGTGLMNIASRRFRVIWVAKWSDHPAVQAWLASFNIGSSFLSSFTTGVICTTTDQAARRCVNINNRLSNAARFMVNNQVGNPLFRTADLEARPNYSRWITETDPLLPGARFGISIQPPFSPWRDMVYTTYWQTLGNNEGDRALAEAPFTELKMPPHPLDGLLDFAWSNGAGDFDSEEDLWARVLPTGTEWTTAPFETVPLSSAVEFRSICAPSRYGVRTAGTNPCEVRQPMVVPFETRSSIDGSEFIERDMTRSSIGAVLQVVASNPAWDADRTREAATSVEVDGRSRVIVRAGRGTVAPAVTLRSATVPVNVTTGVSAPAGCVFANQGMGNVYGPVSINFRYPVGWLPLNVAPASIAQLHYTTATLVFGQTDDSWNLLDGLLPVPADRITSLAHDPINRTFRAELLGPSGDQRFLGTEEVDATLGYQSVRTITLVVNGTFVPGVARRPAFQCDVEVAEAVRPDSTVGVAIYERAPYSNHQVLGIASPSVRGLADRTRSYGWARWAVDVDLRNTAYNANGTLRPNGAALAAQNVASFLRVPRDNDHGEAIENGVVSVSFADADSVDGFDIWVSALDVPQRGTALEVGSSPDWVRCAPAGTPCDADALDDAAMDPEDVRWVAFTRAELPVTDAEPRGVAPLGGATRVDNPLVARVRLRDTGSTTGAVVRPIVELHRSDSLALVAQNGPMDVVIDAWCDARLFSVICDDGIGQCRREGAWICDDAAGEQFCNAEAAPPVAERCDSLDWDCDGAPTNGFLGLGDACSSGLGVCEREGARVCAADGSAVVCGAVPGEPSFEFCDGLDNDCNGLADDLPGTGQPCQVGVGECAGAGVTVCDRELGSTLLCDGVVGQPQPERCDDRDWDCNGEPYNGFEAFGTACFAGDGACRNIGTLVCDEAAAELVCSAVAGDPTAAEVCDGFDNNCSGTVDDVPEIGMACVAGLGECATDGVLACVARRGPAPVCVADLPPSTPELCDDRDWDCDGQTTNGFPVGESCTVVTGLGSCVLPGTWVCAADRERVVCDSGDATCPETRCEVDTGRPCAVGIGACRRSGLTVCVEGDSDAVTCDAQPGGPSAEVCNGIDDDCNGVVDDADEDCSCDGRAGEADDCPGAWTPVSIDLNNNGIGDACECGARCRVFIDGCVVAGTTACEDGAVSGICRPALEALDESGQVREGFCTPAVCGVPEPVCDGPDTDGDGVPEGDGEGCDVCPGVHDPAQATGADAVCACENAGRKCSVLVRDGCYAGGVLVCDEVEGQARCVVDAEIDEDACLPAGCVFEGCDPVAERPCDALAGQVCLAGVGACVVGGETVCEADGVGVRCEGTPGEPGVETCNGRDDDCDGETDEGVCPDVAYLVEGGGGCGGGGAMGLWWWLVVGLGAVGRLRRVRA